MQNLGTSTYEFPEGGYIHQDAVFNLFHIQFAHRKRSNWLKTIMLINSANTENSLLKVIQKVPTSNCYWISLSELGLVYMKST